MNVVDERARPAGKGWLIGGAWLLLVLGLALAFGFSFREMWVRWFPAWSNPRLGLYDRIVGGESYYTHSPLVPLVSLLIALLLIRHTSIPVRPKRAAGIAVLAGSLLLHLLACLARVNFVSGFALIGALAGLVLLLWGATALRRLWFPIAFLAFMVPLPDVSIHQMNFRLKIWAADWGVRLVNLLGIMAERNANRVFLEGDKSLVVANVCNGLRTLISVLAFGALYTYVCRLRGLWRILLFAATVPVALLSNSARIVGLILVADIWDVSTATGLFHDVSGVLIFLIAFLLMFSLERLILWLRRVVHRPAKVLPLFDGVRKTDADEGQWSKMVWAGGSLRGWAAAAVVLLSAAGAWWLNQSVPPVWNQQMARLAVPAEIDLAGKRLSSYEMELDEKTLTILETRDYLFRRYVEAGAAPLDFCVVFSADNRKGTHPPDVCLEGSGEGIIAKADVVLEGIPGRPAVPCKELVVQAGPGQQYFLYTYKCGDTYTRSFWKQQFIIFGNGLLHRNSSGALVRVSTPAAPDLGQARQRCQQMLRAMVPHLDRGLP